MAIAFRHLFSYLDHCSSDFIKGRNVLHLIFLMLGLLQLGVAAYCIKHLQLGSFSAHQN